MFRNDKRSPAGYGADMALVKYKCTLLLLFYYYYSQSFHTYQ